MKIVAPAGNIDSFYAAVKAGANEVYMGLQGFGARRNARNFTTDEYITALEYAHLHGTRVFLTLNTIMYENEMEFIYSNLKKLYENGLDAVIVQDLGFAAFVKKNFPNLELHASTQMKIGNHFEIEFLESLGFTRVVLPRELSFDEIRSIREKTKIELEVFVSGALCVCFSGNCYMSSFIGGRSGNRGLCTQPCRKQYQNSKMEKGYFLSPKDQLYTQDEINKLKKIGIDSIKIEGRMKNESYIFETVKYYCDIIKGSKPIEKTSNIFNRGYDLGYFYGKNINLLNKDYSFNLGKDLGRINGNEIKLLEDVCLGDGITFVDKNYNKLGGYYLNKIIIKHSMKNNDNKNAKKGQIILLRNIPEGSYYIFRSYSKETEDSYNAQYKQSEKKAPLNFTFTCQVGDIPQLTATYTIPKHNTIQCTQKGTTPIEKAQKSSANIENIKTKLSELGNTSFYMQDCQCDIDINAFVPVSLIKDLKRGVVEQIEKNILDEYKKNAPQKYTLDPESINIESDNKNRPILSAIVATKEQEDIVKSYGIKKIYKKGYDIALEESLRSHELNSSLACNLFQIVKNKSRSFTINWNLNTVNRYTIKVFEQFKNLDTIILSPEMSFDKIKEIGKTNAKKALLVYSKLQVMVTDAPVLDKKTNSDIFVNEEGDRFILQKNKLNYVEIFLDKPLNIINKINQLSHMDISECVLEFTVENKEETKKVLEEMKLNNNNYTPYNYEKGVL